MENIKDTYLDHTAITRLPLSINNLIGLEQLFLRQCKRLNQPPNNIKTLPKLEVILASGCKGLQLYEQFGDPEYVSLKVFSSMMVLYNNLQFTTNTCVFKAYIIIISENFINLCIPLWH